MLLPEVPRYFRNVGLGVVGLTTGAPPFACEVIGRPLQDPAAVTEHFARASEGPERGTVAELNVLARSARISHQQLQAGQLPAGCRAPRSTCRKDSPPSRRLKSLTMSDSGRRRLSAQIVNLEQWCVLG
jgi:hypothetical protein